ncbi:MAG TPA: EI24 domain-containing protein [Burkholderiales bacterium]|nr:EI24 domain-containing protein [Burkholderiales bacterium]
MESIARSLWDALLSLFHPKILGLILLPVFLAFVIWGGLSWWFWQDWVREISHLLAQTPLQQFLLRHEIHWVALSLATALLILLLVPVVLATSLLVTSVLAMPVLVRYVGERSFPGLEKKHGGTIWGSLWNPVAATAIFILLWLVTLPIWLLGLPAAVLPILLSAYLSQRLFRYDALAEHASPEEFTLILERSGIRLYVLGAILALTQFVPLLNLFSPVYIGLAYVYFCLGELQRLRSGQA